MQNPIQDCVKIESLKKIDYFGKYNVWLFFGDKNWLIKTY